MAVAHRQEPALQDTTISDGLKFECGTKKGQDHVFIAGNENSAPGSFKRTIGYNKGGEVLKRVRIKAVRKETIGCVSNLFVI